MTRIENKLNRLHSIKQPVFVAFNQFTKKECEFLIDIFKGDEAAAKTDVLKGSEGKQLTFIELERTPCVEDYYAKMYSAIEAANAVNFQFDSNMFLAENMYINKYAAIDDNHRGWHCDGVFSDNPYYSSRKLSAVLQLSDPKDYGGGNLKFMEYHQPEGIDLRGQGNIIIFPAFEWHKVERVISGTRYSMVMFANGTPFK